MDLRKIKKLIELVEESDVRELEVKTGEESIRIARGEIARQSSVPTLTEKIVSAPVGEGQTVRRLRANARLSLREIRCRWGRSFASSRA